MLVDTGDNDTNTSRESSSFEMKPKKGRLDAFLFINERKSNINNWPFYHCLYGSRLSGELRKVWETKVGNC